MTTKKLTAVVCAILMSATCISHVWAGGSKPQELTLLVLPARYAALQVGFDVVARSRTVMVSYQADAETGESLLHAWNGREWIQVPMSDYADSSFLQITPQRAIVVGGDDILPEGLIAATGWCPKVLNVTDIDTASLINALGNLMSFSKHEWQWFAKRYNLHLEDTNAATRRDSWYDERHDRNYLEGRTVALPPSRPEEDYSWRRVEVEEPAVEEEVGVVVEDSSYMVDDEYSVQGDVGSGEPKSMLTETVDEIMEQP